MHIECINRLKMRPKHSITIKDAVKSTLNLDELVTNTVIFNKGGNTERIRVTGEPSLELAARINTYFSEGKEVVIAVDDGGEKWREFKGKISVMNSHLNYDAYELQPFNIIPRANLNMTLEFELEQES